MDASEIGTFEPGKSLYLYGIAIGVLPGLTRVEKRVYGSKLVGGFLNVIVDWGRRGIILDTIVARSTKPDGIQLHRNPGFTQIPSVTEKKDFVLRVETSGSKQAMLYNRHSNKAAIGSQSLLALKNGLNRTNNERKRSRRITGEITRETAQDTPERPCLCRGV